MIKDKIVNLLRQTNRPGIENLINYLQNESDFFTAPCSSQYHLPMPGGLAQHSLNVHDLMIKVCQNTGINLPGDSVILSHYCTISAKAHIMENLAIFRT
jgi:23S rRNA maturation-related 3'-5' exoribonuclease YhaM